MKNETANRLFRAVRALYESQKSGALEEFPIKILKQLDEAYEEAEEQYKKEANGK